MNHMQVYISGEAGNGREMEVGVGEMLVFVDLEFRLPKFELEVSEKLLLDELK